ncbi:MAG TPA: glycosyltransferase [Solirubrobacterales bacterium]
MRVLSVGSLPPAWGGPSYGGVATCHATLLEGFLSPRCPVDIVGVVTTEPVAADRPVRSFIRPRDESIAAFYGRLLGELEPDAVIMHHFAHTIGVTHAGLNDAPPAIGIAHSWHNITLRSGEEQQRARETTQRALDGLQAVVGVSHHCLLEGEDLGLRFPPISEMIHLPLQPLYSTAVPDLDLDGRERNGVAYLGSLTARKRPAALVEAAARLPGTGVVLAGHGELEDRLRALISSLALDERVDIRRLDDLGVRALLLGSEAMCLPSRSETFGLAYTEALACGTPVVGFGPTLHEIRDEVGVDIGESLDTGQPEEVAAAIQSVLARDWDRGNLRRRTLAAFDLPKAIERYETLLAKVLGPARAKSNESAGRGLVPSTGELSSDPICVLGMSRTGSSLTARVLNLLGVYLGHPEDLLNGKLHQLAGEGDEVLAKAKEANPAGFWEHYRIMRLNERILRTHGGSWRDPPTLPVGWEQSHELDAERREARSLLRETFAGQPLWGWKDPRNCLTLPFWERLVPRARYVICLRNPLDVASSLQRRDGMPLQQGIGLWRAYVIAALLNTSGRPRLFVPYENHFDDPHGTVERLARFAGREAALGTARVLRELADAVDERLWRNRSTTADIVQDERVPEDATHLHLLTELLAIESPEADDLQKAVDLYAERCSRQYASVQS